MAFQTPLPFHEHEKPNMYSVSYLQKSQIIKNLPIPIVNPISANTQNVTPMIQ